MERRRQRAAYAQRDRYEQRFRKRDRKREMGGDLLTGAIDTGREIVTEGERNRDAERH